MMIINMIYENPAYYTLLALLFFISVLILIALLNRLLPWLLKGIKLLITCISKLFYLFTGGLVMTVKKINLTIVAIIIIGIEEIYNYIVGGICSLLEAMIEKKFMIKRKFIVSIVVTCIMIFLNINYSMFNFKQLNSWVDSITQEVSINQIHTRPKEEDFSFELNYDLMSYNLVEDVLVENKEVFKDTAFAYNHEKLIFENNIYIFVKDEFGENYFIKQPDNFIDKKISINKIYASTELSFKSSGQLVTYPAQNLIDGDYTSAWIESTGGSGIGESITFQVDNAISFDEIEILNGFQRALSTYQGNERVKKLQIIVDNEVVYDNELEFYGLDDFNKVNILYFDQPIVVNEIIEFIITDVQTNEESEYKDTAISEVTFYSFTN